MAVRREAWKRAWRERGEAALAARPHPGPEPRLSIEDRERLERILLSGARKAGFDSDLWTCPRVAAVIQRRFGGAYHPDHVSRILHKLGWSCRPCRSQADNLSMTSAFDHRSSNPFYAGLNWKPVSGAGVNKK